VPAVLQRPDTLDAQSPGPLQHLVKPTGTDRRRLVSEHLARRRRDTGDGVRALVHVRTEHDHQLSPLLLVAEVDSRRTRLAEGAATLLSSHAGHPRPATSDTTKGSQGTGRQPQRESARRRSGPSPRRRTSPTPQNHNSKPRSVSAAAAPAARRRPIAGGAQLRVDWILALDATRARRCERCCVLRRPHKGAGAKPDKSRPESRTQSGAYDGYSVVDASPACKPGRLLLLLRLPGTV